MNDTLIDSVVTLMEIRNTLRGFEYQNEDAYRFLEELIFCLEADIIEEIDVD